MRGYLAGVVFALGLLSMEPGCDAAAQDPPPAPVDPELARTVDALARALASSKGGSDYGTPGAIIIAAVGVLGAIWRIAPQVGRDPEVAAALARIEANQKRTDEELIRLRDTVHNKLDAVHGRLGNVELDVREASSSLERVDTLSDRIGEIERRPASRR